MASASVKVLNEVSRAIGNGEWKLFFQWCEYKYDDGSLEKGYRFIWKRPDGSLQAARGQARIPSAAIALELMSEAMHQGWGHYTGDVH